MTQEELFKNLDEIVAKINLPTKSYEITSDLLVFLKVIGTPPLKGGACDDCNSAVKNKLREAMALLSFSPKTTINLMLDNHKEQKNDRLEKE